MNERDVADLAWIPVILLGMAWVGQKIDAEITAYFRMRDQAIDNTKDENEGEIR